MSCNSLQLIFCFITGCVVYIHILQLLEFSINLISDFLELFFRELEMLLAEVDISFAIHRDEVDMSMRNLKTQYNLSHFLAWESSLDGLSNLLGENLKLCQVIILHVEDVIYLLAGNHQCMTFADRANVEESIELVAFCTLVARNLSCCNL